MSAAVETVKTNRATRKENRQQKISDFKEARAVRKAEREAEKEERRLIRIGE